MKRTAMSKEELKRVEVMGRVKAGGLKITDAAVMLAISYRQAKRLWRQYRKRGADGLKHGNAGRRSNRAKTNQFRRQVLRFVRKKYSGSPETRFGPTLAAQHLLEEDGLSIDAETLRRWMLSEGLWSRERKRSQHRQRRERRGHFGELVQMDGSFHAWLEERGPDGCLMNMVDDATSVTLSRLGEQETIWAAVGVLRRWIERYGVPKALYTDWKNVYKRGATTKEQLHGIEPETQFGRMCERLGIAIIGAHSAQAKGRVERSNGTQQDRLVKKLRRKGIATHTEANEYIEAEYLLDHNRRFSCKAREAEDYHSRAPGKKELDAIFRLEEERTISNDWVVRYRGLLLQLKPLSRTYGPTRAKAVVCQWEDGRIEVRYREEWIAHERIEGSERVGQQDSGEKQRRVKQGGLRMEPAKEHPWKRSYLKMKAEPRRVGNA